ncbi:hypothetical protein FACS1894200_12930 [Spirochaetia bacterium]|nr:hypothetical protein FACS1894200_12930 [Spirochaetia bacterium]
MKYEVTVTYNCIVEADGEFDAAKAGCNEVLNIKDYADFKVEVKGYKDESGHD